MALRPPPLPQIEEPDAEALDFEEEMDDTEWHDVSAIVCTSHAPPALASTPAPGAASMPSDTEVIAFRDGAAAHVVAFGQRTSALARAAAFFVGYVVADGVALLRQIVPGARAFVARLGVQWMRARERART